MPTDVLGDMQRRLRMRMLKQGGGTEDSKPVDMRVRMRGMMGQKEKQREERGWLHSYCEEREIKGERVRKRKTERANFSCLGRRSVCVEPEFASKGAYSFN